MNHDHDEDDPEGGGSTSSSGLEMRPMEIDNNDQEAPSSNVPEPMTWSKSQVMKQQNRCFAVLMVVLVIITAVYFVSDSYLNDNEDTLLESYNAQGGILTDEYDSPKQEENAMHAQQQQHQTTGKKRNHTNHNNNNNQRPWQQHMNDNQDPYAGNGAKTSPLRAKEAARERWKQNHPGQDFPERLKGDHAVGNRTHPGGGNGIKNNNNNNNNDVDVTNLVNHLPSKSAQPYANTPTTPPIAQPDSCDLSPHHDWLNKTIAKSDGIQYKVLQQLHHDDQAFTQGLTYYDGVLYESTGLWGQSSVRILDPISAKVLSQKEMSAVYFGEGMTIFFNGTQKLLIQITWKSKHGFIYDPATLDIVQEFDYSTTKGEGWGITYDDCQDELIVTDGSKYLHFWDPSTLEETRKVEVMRLDGRPANQLNEIEFWRGRVLANVWYEDVLLVIHPGTGYVEKEYDFSALWPKTDRKPQGADVFNGISVSNDPNILYVTGKLWNRIFLVELN